MLRSLIAGALLLGTSPALAQPDLPSRGAPLAQRVTAARDGTVRLTFTVRPDVCGDGNNVRVIRDGSRTFTDDGWRRSRDVEWDVDCQSGPGRVAVDVRGGEVADLRFYVGGRWRPAGADVTDLGQVPTDQAAGFLLGLAERGAGRAARNAVFPSTLVDSVTVWPTLLKIARDDHADRETRSQSVFWLGQAAGDAATKGLTELADDPESEIRDQAVFALSRRPADEGIPALIRIARTHRDPKTRRTAMFWLGHSKDPRALALFEEILTGK
jgi:HEAT repeat protein